ncbi:pknH-like extracellular domain protein [Mycobacterium kansasii]|nr:pknH-like extracellular domain protein [Mycobacterium kansasii]
MMVSAHGDQLRAPQGTLSEPACLAAYEPFQESVYRPHAPTEVRSQVLHTQGENPAHRVIEAAATFPSAEKARAFVQASADKWATCANQTVKFTSSTKASEWTFGDVTGASLKLPRYALRPTAAGRPASMC